MASDELVMKVLGMPLEQRRNEIAQRYYSKSYSSCCWRQREAVDSVVDKMDNRDSGVGG